MGYCLPWLMDFLSALRTPLSFTQHRPLSQPWEGCESLAFLHFCGVPPIISINA